MTPKPPTPQGVSALLKRAGFARAVIQMRGGCSGFRVTKDHGREGRVRVRHHTWTMASDDARHQRELARYAKTITEAGWSVEVGTYELVVTAGKAEQ